MIVYILKVTIGWSIFYMFYHFFLSKLTYFKINRFYLLFSLLLGLLIPNLGMITWSTEAVPMTEMVIPIAETFDETIQLIPAAIPDNKTDWSLILCISYLIMVAYFLTRLVRNYLLISSIKKQGKHSEALGVNAVHTDQDLLPFSFLNDIFINKTKIENTSLEYILIHEACHVKQKHSLDIILIELLKCFFWISPIIYFYKTSIKTVHEYLADDGVLQSKNIKEYGQLLLGQSIPSNEIALAHSFFHSQLKQRIIMMCKKRSAWPNKLRYFLAIPALLFLGIIFSGYQLPTELEIWNEPIEPIISVKKESQKIGSAEIKSTEVKMVDLKVYPEKIAPVKNSDCKKAINGDYYYWVDEQAYLSICNSGDAKARERCTFDKLAEYYNTKFEYTAAALKEGYQGFLAWTLVIDENGKIDEIKKPKNIASKKSFGMYDVGSEIINQMRNEFTFVPARCDGSKVRSWFPFSHRHKVSPEQMSLVEVKNASTVSKPFMTASITHSRSDGGISYTYRSNLNVPYEIQLFNPTGDLIHTASGDYMYKGKMGHFVLENPTNGIYKIVAMQDGIETTGTMDINLFN